MCVPFFLPFITLFIFTLARVFCRGQIVNDGCDLRCDSRNYDNVSGWPDWPSRR